MMEDFLVFESLSVAEEVLEGRGASCGRIARLIGKERYSRLVGTMPSVAGFQGEKHYE